MRKDHPAFRMTTAKDIFANVTLDEASTDSVVIININGQAVKDSWNKIKVVMNSTKDAATVTGIDGMTKVADGYTVGNDVEQNNSAAPQAMSIWVSKADDGGQSQEPEAPQFSAMSLIGSETNWSVEEMTYNNGKWISAEHDFTANSEFKIFTNGNDSWGNQDDQYGQCTEGDTVLTSNSNCGNNAPNVKGKQGKYVVVDDQTLAWDIVSEL